MLTIKVFLASSGQIATLDKDFPLYQGQFQNKLLNVYVPTAILTPNYATQHYVCQQQGNTYPTASEMNAWVQQYLGREKQGGDIIDFVYTNTDPSTFYEYTYNATTSTWNIQQVDKFNVTAIGGTNIDIGCVALARNGQIKKSKTYPMRYVKTLTNNGVEYALYERKLPKEFTVYSGQGVNAPKMIINVVNVDFADSTIIQIVTSQSASIDVMPSTVLDADESIDATAQQELQAQINAIQGNLADKQDKVDETLATTQKSVVGAINGLNTRMGTAEGDIDDAEEDIADLDERVTALEGSIATGETYIGTLTRATLPTDAELDAYVLTTVGRASKNGDTVIVIQQIAGATDKNYKYIKGASGWSHYEIPPIESASNGSLGIVKGTYGVGSANTTIVDIQSGEIKGVYYNNVNVGVQASENADDIADIIDGTQTVGKSTMATGDGMGNNIVNTYQTKTEGATKVFVKGYALPRQFNDALYPTESGNYATTRPDDDTSIASVTSTAIGYTTLTTQTYTLPTDMVFELSAKNSYTANYSISVDDAEKCSFTISTYIQKSGESAVLISTDNTEEYEWTVAGVKTIKFGVPFENLTEVVSMQAGDTIYQVLQVFRTSSASRVFQVWDNTVNKSEMFLNTQSTTLVVDRLAEKFEGSEYIVVEPNEGGTKVVIELDQTNLETEMPTAGSDKLVTSGAVSNGLVNKQNTLVGVGLGQNIKTVNGQNILGSGDITTAEVYWCEMNVTTFAQITSALGYGRLPVVEYENRLYVYNYSTIDSGTQEVSGYDFVSNVGLNHYVVSVSSSNVWSVSSSGAGRVDDVQINGTSIVANKIANIPQATSADFGVVKVNPSGGTNQSGGILYLEKATENELIAKTSNAKPVVPLNLDIAIREGLGNNSLTWTEEYKQNARNTIGASASYTFSDGLKQSGNNVTWSLSDRIAKGINGKGLKVGDLDKLRATADGAFAFGSGNYYGQVYATGTGSLALGYSVANNSNRATIEAGGAGAVAIGYIYNTSQNYGRYGQITASNGAMARGQVAISSNESKYTYISARSAGSFASGIANDTSGSVLVDLYCDGGHAMGYGVQVANGASAGQCVVGKCNATSTTAQFIVGNGTNDTTRSNAFVVEADGNATLAGKLTVGADPTNAMEVATKQYVDSNALPSGSGHLGEALIHITTGNEWMPITSAYIKSTGVTSGKVLTADGNGGTSWEDAGGGGMFDEVATDAVMSKTQVGGSAVELASFSSQDNHWHIANSKVDDTLTIDGELELGATGDLGANLQSEINALIDAKVLTAINGNY